MVQPPTTATTVSPHSFRSFSSTVSALYTHFISIPYYFIGVLNFCRAAWRLLCDLYALIREWTSRKSRRQLRIRINKWKHDPDLLIDSAGTCAQVAYLVYPFACVLAVLLPSFIPYKPIRDACERVKKHAQAEWERHGEYLDWEREASEADVILFTYEFKDKVVRRLKRRVSKAFHAFVHMFLPETIARKVLQLASILAVWQKTSLDHVRERNGPSKPAALPLQAGFVRVRLAFPTCNRSDNDDPWGLSKRYSIIDDFMVEPDGSLDLTKVTARWDLEAISILDPNRFQPFETSQPNRLSPLAIQVLTMRDNQITIVEERSYFLRKRVQLRQALLASRLYFFVRLAVWLLIFAGVCYGLGYVTCQMRQVHYAAPTVFVLELFLNYVGFCHQCRRGRFRNACRWISLPERYPESYIYPKNELFCLWMEN